MNLLNLVVSLRPNFFKSKKITFGKSIGREQLSIDAVGDLYVVNISKNEKLPNVGRCMRPRNWAFWIILFTSFEGLNFLL